MSASSSIRARRQAIARHDGVSLREFIQIQIEGLERRLVERIAALEKLLQARLDAMQLAIDTWRIALDARLEQMNEIRGQLATQKSEFVTNERLDALMSLSQADRKALIDKIDALEKQMATQANLAREQTQKDLDVQRNRTDDGFKTVNADIRSLREARSQTTGSQITSREFMGYAIAVLAIIAAVVSRFLP